MLIFNIFSCFSEVFIIFQIFSSLYTAKVKSSNKKYYFVLIFSMKTYIHSYTKSKWEFNDMHKLLTFIELGTRPKSFTGCSFNCLFLQFYFFACFIFRRHLLLLDNVSIWKKLVVFCRKDLCWRVVVAKYFGKKFKLIWENFEGIKGKNITSLQL